MRKTCDPFSSHNTSVGDPAPKLTLLLCRLFMQAHELTELNGLAEGWVLV